MTSLMPTGTKLDALIAKAGTKLTDILDELALTKAERAKEKAAKTHRPIPKVVPVSPEDRKTLRTLVDRVADFVFPDDVRELTEAERKVAIQLFDEIKNGKKVLVKFEDTFKLTFQNHLDVALGESAKKLDQDKDGHYIAAGIVGHPELSRCVARELRGGHAGELTLEDLQSLVASGDLSMEDFKAMTVPVPRQVIAATRAVSEAGVMNRIKADPKVLLALAKVAKLTPQTTAINMRDVKVGQ